MKSKVKIIIIVFVLFVVGVAVVIPKSTYQKWFGNTPANSEENENNENKATELVYVKNSDGLVVGLNVKVKESNDDQIVQKWNLLTKDSDVLPSGFESTINKDTTLYSYQINGTILELNVSQEIIESDGRATAEALAWTYVNEEIEEIQLFVDGVKVEKINDYQVSKISKKMGINLEYETSYLLESTATTIIFCEAEYLKPVTYFHLNEDVCSYIVEKTYDELGVETNWDYEYELSEDSLVINFQDNLVLDERALMTLTYSFDANFEITKLSINNIEKNLYEAVFGEIVEE